MEFKNQAVAGGIAVEKNSFIWTIENFDIVRQSEDYINSQIFKFTAGKTLGLITEWEVFLRTKTEENEGTDEKWIGCSLRRNPPRNMDGRPAAGVNARWGLSINKNDHTSFFRRTIPMRSFVNDDKLETDWVLGKILRQDAELSDLPLINGCLVMELTVEQCGPLKTAPHLLKTADKIATLEKRYKDKFLTKLTQDMDQALDEPSQRSDAQTKIISKDAVEFKVNRGILSARSPVFEQMFQTEMSKSENGIVKINDISSQTMSTLLRFIYSGSLKDDWRDSNVIVELLHAAGKYQLSDLMDFFNEILGSVCCRETVVDLMNLARKLSMEKAEKDLFEYMKKNVSTYDDMIFFTRLPKDSTNQSGEKEKRSESEVVDSEPIDADD